MMFFPVRAVAQGSLCPVGLRPQTAPCLRGLGGFFVCIFIRFPDNEVTFECICAVFSDCCLMGMSRQTFLVKKCICITKVSCFSVHVCSQLSQISCFVFFPYFAHICVILCLCAAVCGRQFLSRADTLIILRCFLRAVYGNVVFSRSKMGARHKSLVFSPVRAEAHGSLCVVGLRP